MVVANHHSWWDAYLAWGLAVHHERPSGAVMDDAQLDRFRFFTHLGAVPASRPRAAARRASEGAWMVVFPEARLRPVGPARRRRGREPRPSPAGPACRCGRWPSARSSAAASTRSSSCAAACRSRAGADAAATDAALAAVLARLDADLAAAIDPEAPVPGYEAWWPGRGSTHERAGWVARLWGGGAGRRTGGAA